MFQQLHTERVRGGSNLTTGRQTELRGAERTRPPYTPVCSVCVCVCARQLPARTSPKSDHMPARLRSSQARGPLGRNIANILAPNAAPVSLWTSVTGTSNERPPGLARRRHRGWLNSVACGNCALAGHGGCSVAT
ncbi:hypothetical protein MPTK1_6g10850 [Marchantia polymorpha subsp. ruderalis]|uniref:Uncharacterized protein n=2 Tax=Marchantia polymorpha TaxID=3197 RepID=A0AAF6BQQ7_MARPO|nr:hypothetical protein MARPO_0016s0124 [Marchantia polymorpha]BBN14341.1 hypothetical protein Mp_6g10850 [Marchantia polymorpha subsp. ruderalis]|eukprot:PTQ45074.1 hypothetical protein MARPO_0016s0124 [Marchantia polymorpha]